MEGYKPCPCLHTTPCDERCTCVIPVSSSGCRRCCSYGSKEQQVAMAEHLAGQTLTEEDREALEFMRERLPDMCNVKNVYWEAALAALDRVLDR